MRILFVACLLALACAVHGREVGAPELEPGEPFKHAFEKLGIADIFPNSPVYRDLTVQDIIDLTDAEVYELLKDEMKLPVVQRSKLAKFMGNVRDQIAYRGPVIPAYDKEGKCIHCDIISNNPLNFYLPKDDEGDVEKNVQRLLKENGWNEVYDFEHADLCWLWGNSESEMDSFYKQEDGHSPWRKRIINQIPKEDAMINKGLLMRNLQEYNKTLGENAPIYYEDVHPESYLLNDPEDCKRFFAQLPAEAGLGEAWVLKEGHAAMGEGITMHHDFAKLREQFTDAGGLCGPKENSGAQMVIQKYINNPLLLRQRKSEVRLYWVVASLDPLMVYSYFTGTVRLTASIFSMANFDNPLIHITNINQQKKFYDEFAVEGETLHVDELKWNFQRLEADLVDREMAEVGYMNDTLVPRLRKMLIYAVNATVAKLPKDPAFFGIYGADFILDGNLRPYLTELQFAPDLAHSKSPKKEVIPPMLKEALNIVLEIRERRRAGLPLSAPKLSAPGYTPIIDLSQDPPFYAA